MIQVEGVCYECGAEITEEVKNYHEIVPCPDCGIELEVWEKAPHLRPAPEVQDDWGE